MSSWNIAGKCAGIIALAVFAGGVFGGSAQACDASCMAVGQTAQVCDTGYMAAGQMVQACDASCMAVGQTAQVCDTGYMAAGQMVQVCDTRCMAVGLTAPAPSAGEIAAVEEVSELPAGTVLSQEKFESEQIQAYFASYLIEDEILERINGKSYVENPDISLEELRYLKVLHYNFQHEIQVGELIVNEELAPEFLEIFQELFEEEYEIYSMYLIDDFWTGDGNESDEASIEANNTSAFCYRTIEASGNLSNHALGRAIDINPLQNPYVSYASGVPEYDHENAAPYVDRESGLEHMITHEDLCFQVFAAHGFTWGGDWDSPKDYQHFEKK